MSLGAECIMLSKSFFMRHANDRVKKRLNDVVQPYPDEEALQSSLQVEADWAIYEKVVLGHITRDRGGWRGQLEARR